MRLMCRVYIIKQHKEIQYMGDSVNVETDRTIYEEKCIVETEDYLDLGEEVRKELFTKLSIPDLYDVRKTLNDGKSYVLEQYDTDPVTSKFVVEYVESGTTYRNVEQKIFLRKEWTIEK